MPTQKLTKTTIENLEAPHPSGKQVLVWDTALKGFGVLLSAKTATKSYVVQRNLPDGRVRRVTIGACNVIPLDDKKENGKVLIEGARTRAEKVLAEFYSGIDPKEKRRKEAEEKQKEIRRSVTLQATLDGYLTARKDLRPQSVKAYRYTIERHLATWLDKPLREITPEMVEDRHSVIQQEVECERNARAAKAGREHA